MSKGSQARLSYALPHFFFVAWLNQFAVRKFYKIGSSSQETKCLEKEQLLFAKAGLRDDSHGCHLSRAFRMQEALLWYTKGLMWRLG